MLGQQLYSSKINLQIVGAVKPVLPPPRGKISPDGNVGWTCDIPEII